MANPPNELTIDLINACKAHSGRVAIEGEGVTISYATLLAEAESLGQQLLDAGQVFKPSE